MKRTDMALYALLGAAVSMGAYYIAWRPTARRGIDSAEKIAECAARAATVLQNGGIFMQPNFLGPGEVDALRRSVSALKFASAKYGRSENPLKDAKAVRKTKVVSVAELVEREEAGGTPMPVPIHGLLARLQALRSELEAPLSLNEDTELSLLKYPTGGFYRSHKDSGYSLGSADRPATATSPAAHRALSFICFLTPEDWVTGVDGGQLRLHGVDVAAVSSGAGMHGGAEQPQPAALAEAGAMLQPGGGGKGSDGSSTAHWVDVTPTAGALVVFNSVEVDHEVLKTRRERLAAVGWWYQDILDDDEEDGD
jgi:hypothetical protein